MKSQKGITLISLVMTIILIMILASVGTYTGFETYENMRVEAFVAKMKTVQEAVDKFCDSHTVLEIINATDTETDKQKYGLPASSAPSDSTAILNSVIKEGMSSGLKSWYSNAGDDSITNYRYFSKEDISTILGIKDFDTPIFFNPRSRNVVAVEGVKYDGKMYYRQYDLSGGQTLTAPNPDTDFTLSVQVRTFDDKAVIYANVSDTDKTITELKYQKKIGASSYDEPIISKSLSEITITESGTYKVIAKTTSTQGHGEVTKESVDQVITIVNKPLLVAGMTPVKMTGVGAYTQITDEQRKQKADAYQDWYNYSEGSKKWANAKLSDGSVYVWIPRYAYAIEETKDAAKTKYISIEFMKGTSSVITTSGKALGKSYNVMPAFEDGSTTGFSNGEWDAEITGIWVAKYETTSNSSKPANKYENKSSWTGATPEEAFKACRNMELGTTYFLSTVAKPTGTLAYGVFPTDTNNIDTHLMKNSEYAAVAYLTATNYGNKTITSLDNTSKKANIADNSNSTTGNMYGIYTLIGSTRDMVAAGHDIATAKFNSENKSTKYATYYPATKTDNSAIIGDGIKETEALNSSTKTYGSVIFARGGLNSAGGIFAYDNKNASGGTDDSFRPVLIVEY